MTPQRIDELIAVYRDGLLKDTLPFWLDHAVDRDCGGFCFCLGRNGEVIDTDKPIWTHGRFIWLLSTLYNTVERRHEWLAMAEHGLTFLLRHAFDDDGRMFFLLTRDGRPLRKRRYLFTECFATIALAAYALAAGSDEMACRAGDLFRLVLAHHSDPALSEPKLNPRTRPVKGVVMPIILTATAQVLRETIADELAEKIIDRAIAEIERDFLDHDRRCLREQSDPEGRFIDHFEQRLVNPGHAMEAAWFILHEARHRGGDEHLTRLGCTILDYSWQLSWDERHGGILYFRDAAGREISEYWHDMKFWWPHTEAVIATLLAWRLTGEPKYAAWHGLVHDWAHEHFADGEYGEWFGYLHRDGSVSSELKGNWWKGPFHLPRMQWYCWRLLEATRPDGGSA